VKSDAELVTGPGWVEVRRAGLRDQRIRAKDIVGASTAEVEGGVLLTLAHKARRTPILLEVATEDDAEVVRRALGIGHGGFGALSWQATRTGLTTWGILGRIAWAVGPFVILALKQFAPSVKFLGVFALLGMMLGLVLTFVDWFSGLALPAPPIGMDARGVTVWTKAGWSLVPYAEIGDVRVEPDRIVLETSRGEVATERSRFAWNGEGLSDEDARALAAQVTSAARRARGQGRPKDDRASQLETLRRRDDEPAREWLLRLDALGRTLDGGGYRGTSLDTKDLLSVLDDPEADPALRAGVARVLRSSAVPDAKIRIDAAVATTHDEQAARFLRVATGDDLDAAAFEIGSAEPARRGRT